MLDKRFILLKNRDKRIKINKLLVLINIKHCQLIEGKDKAYTAEKVLRVLE